MTRARLVLATAGILLGATAAAQAQTPAGSQPPAVTIVVTPPGELRELVLRDGTQAVGRVEKIDGTTVTFRTTSGAAIEVDASKILSITPATGRVVEGAYWPADSNPTRLFFAPTGRTLKRGESYFGVYEFMMPFVQFGVTDRISVGAGTPLIFGGGGEHPFWVTPKLQIVSAPRTQASIGVMHFMNVGDGSFGIAYGVVTQGSADSAASVGLGWAYERYDDGSGTAVLMLGGEHRVSRRTKIITENYLFDGGGFASAGVRFLGERLSADLSMVVPLGIDEFVAFPMINFVWKFDSKGARRVR